MTLNALASVNPAAVLIVVEVALLFDMFTVGVPVYVRLVPSKVIAVPVLVTVIAPVPN